MLRAWLINYSTNGPQRAELNRLANPGNAYRPCYDCTITSTRALNGHYYVVYNNQHFT